MSETKPFRAQCASCMRVFHDPTAAKCPGCGSTRVVVQAGKLIKPSTTAKPHRPRTRLDPRPVAETCDVCGAPPGIVCDMAEHRKQPPEVRYRKSKWARQWHEKKRAEKAANRHRVT